MDKNVTELTGYDLGKLVYSKSISISEVLSEFKKKIESVNPELNAFVYTKFDEAFEEAKELQEKIDKDEYIGIFAGCPIALKDFLPTKKGWTASHGGVPSLVTVDDYDCEFWKTAKKLGCIAVGKTNSPAYGFRGTCDNKMYGPTKNPFNYDYNSGGSSGGSAAAVGAKFTPFAIGGDAGGSVRIPASWCGCFGFKPSARIVPDVCRPDAWTATHPYCCDGPITRSVKDAAALMNHAVRYDPRDPLSVPLTFDFLEAINRPAFGLTVGITYNFDLFPDPDPQIIRAINTVVDQLKELHIAYKYVNFDFKYKLPEYEEAWLRSISVDTAIEAELTKDQIDLYSLTDELPEEFLNWNRIAFSSSLLDYRKFHEIRTDVLDAHLNVFKDVDIIIAPVTGCLPVKNASEGLTQGPSEINGVSVNPLIGFAYTYLENMIGTPAAAMPVTHSVKENLPIGIQVIGKRYRDEDVFTVCQALEDVNKP